jgi:hypothetical protein
MKRLVSKPGEAQGSFEGRIEVVPVVCSQSGRDDDNDAVFEVIIGGRTSSALVVRMRLRVLTIFHRTTRLFLIKKELHWNERSYVIIPTPWTKYPGRTG